MKLFYIKLTNGKDLLAVEKKDGVLHDPIEFEIDPEYGYTWRKFFMMTENKEFVISEFRPHILIVRPASDRACALYDMFITSMSEDGEGEFLLEDANVTYH